MGRNESMGKLLIKKWEGKSEIDDLPNKNRGYPFTLSGLAAERKYLSYEMGSLIWSDNLDHISQNVTAKVHFQRHIFSFCLGMTYCK